MLVLKVLIDYGTEIYLQAEGFFLVSVLVPPAVNKKIRILYAGGNSLKRTSSTGCSQKMKRND